MRQFQTLDEEEKKVIEDFENELGKDDPFKYRFNPIANMLDREQSLNDLQEPEEGDQQDMDKLAIK